MTVINTAPTLITERLRLDAHTLDDFDSLAALWADPLVVRYIGGTPRDREDSWRLMRYVGHWRCWDTGIGRCVTNRAASISAASASPTSCATSPRRSTRRKWAGRW